MTLQHPNIVKYKGFVKTREFLYIILECVPLMPDLNMSLNILQVL